MSIEKRLIAYVFVIGIIFGAMIITIGIEICELCIK